MDVECLANAGTLDDSPQNRNHINMDIMQLASQLLADNVGQPADGDTLTSALTSLLGNNSGDLDLAGLAGKMSADSDLGSVLGTWLGDGANAPISADSLMNVLGEGQIAEFASRLGIDPQTAANSLTDVIPQLMDKSSSGGSLLDSVGGMDGLMGAARSFLK